MRVVGIDPSTRTGVAVVENGKVLGAEELSFPSLDWIPRADAIAQDVLSTCEDFNPDLVAIEGFSYASKFNNAVQYEIGYVLRYLLWKRYGKFAEPAPSLVKKFATGGGKATKRDMIRVVKERWGFETTSDNMADAVAIAMYAYSLKAKIP